jgi:hypothetical protein
MFSVVHESSHVFAGQYIYVVAELATLRDPSQFELDAFAFPRDFLATLDRHCRYLQSRPKTPAAVWGGASKGVTFALFMERKGVGIDLVVDVNPSKQGKFLPGTGLQVRSPEQALEILPGGADVFVMNGNYLEEIRALTGNRFNYLTMDHDFI